MGIPRDHPAILQAIERGLITVPSDGAPTPVAAKTKREKPELVAASHEHGMRGGVAYAVWVIPLVTHSEANGREWRARSNHTQQTRKAVSRAFGPTLAALAVFASHYHAGGALRIVFTRLGGRQLDRSNLPNAMKATEDSLALLIGADDGDARWRAEWGQEPGGPSGVRIELEAA